LPPPVFVGRKKAITDIENAALRAWKPGASGHGEPKATQILQGAPGAGKSSILAALNARSRAHRRAGAPRILTLNAADFQDISGVYRSLASAVNPREADRLFEDSRRGLHVGGAVKLMGTGFDGAMERGRAQTAPEPTMRAFADWVLAWSGADGARPSPWNFPLIVAIDEAQRLPPGERTPVAYFVQAIHDATTKLPLTLVLAGLGDTADRAGKMGLTRGLNPHEVGSLAAPEVDDLVRGFCKRFGLRANGSEPNLVELAAGAEGWPRHLHFALQALGDEALAADGDLARISWSRAAKRTADSRLRYNRAQQSGEMKAGDRLVAAVMRDLRDGMSWSGIVGLIEMHVADEPGFRLPESTTSEKFRRLLVHQGALHEGADGRFRCPIPSFRRFLIAEGERCLASDPVPARPPEPEDQDDSPSPF